MATDGQTVWGSTRAQWQSNARLRWAVLAAIALLWLWLLLLWSDRIDARAAQADALRSAVERNKPLGRDPRLWPARADESGKQLAAMRAMLWRESDLGVAEAALQDELRQLASRVGVSWRELLVTRVDRPRTVADGSMTASAHYQELRARMRFDFRRDRTLALLSELAQTPRMIVVERLSILTGAQPPSAEIELRVVVDTQPRSTP